MDHTKDHSLFGLRLPGYTYIYMYIYLYTFQSHYYEIALTFGLGVSANLGFRNKTKSKLGISSELSFFWGGELHDDSSELLTLWCFKHREKGSRPLVMVNRNTAKKKNTGRNIKRADKLTTTTQPVKIWIRDLPSTEWVNQDFMSGFESYSPLRPAFRVSKFNRIDSVKGHYEGFQKKHEAELHSRKYRTTSENGPFKKEIPMRNHELLGSMLAFGSVRKFSKWHFSGILEVNLAMDTERSRFLRVMTQATS